MLEKQFIQFSETSADADCLVPIVFGQEGTTVFYNAQEADDIWVTIIDADATQNYLTGRVIGVEGWNSINVSQLFTAAQAEAIPDGAIVRILLEIQAGGVSVASQPLIKLSSMDGLAVVKYKCTPDAFGFPFASCGYAVATLPILLTQPQYGQEDKVYTKSNGDIVVLYAQHRKEWSGETEYLPELMHDKIVTALVCDEVYINGVRVTKSDNYNVDWDNYTFDDCGNRIARATFKVKANVIARNSNCG